MGASVRIEDEAFSDDRYEDLAFLAGLMDADHARGKMARLWRQCTLESRHILPVATVVRVLGPKGVEALIQSRLGTAVDDGVRIHGTKGRIEWLKKLRSNGKFGKRGGRPRNNPDGFSGEPSRVSKNNPFETPPAPAPAPALESLAATPAQPVLDKIQEHLGDVGVARALGKKPRAKRAAHSLPADWVPSPEHTALALERGVDLELQVRKFKAHAEANGRTCKVWNAAFTQWLLGSYPERQVSPSPQTTIRKLERLA